MADQVRPKSRGRVHHRPGRQGHRHPTRPLPHHRSVSRITTDPIRFGCRISLIGYQGAADAAHHGARGSLRARWPASASPTRPGQAPGARTRYTAHALREKTAARLRCSCAQRFASGGDRAGSRLATGKERALPWVGGNCSGKPSRHRRPGRSQADLPRGGQGRSDGRVLHLAHPGAGPLPGRAGRRRRDGKRPLAARRGR